MCNLYTHKTGLADLAAAFAQVLQLDLDLPAGEATLSNQPWAETVYPKYQGLFVRPADARAPAGPLEPAVGRWGLVPFFHKGPAAAWKFPTNNARSEEMATKASFRDAVKARRCIIPATAICEWTGPKGSKTQHWISARDGAPLFLAGLWGTHRWEGEETVSYTMVMQATTPACDMAPFHDRQPVFLTAETAPLWLDLAADPAAAVRCPEPGMLVADPPEPVAA